MKKFISFTLCMILCLSSCILTSCTSSEAQVSNITSIAVISETMHVAEADRYTLTAGKKEVTVSGNAHNIVNYGGERINITINSHNIADEYKDMFDQDESMTFTVGTKKPEKDNLILIFAELSIENDNCYLTVTQQLVLTDASGKVSIRKTSDKFNLTDGTEGTIPSIYEA